MLIVLELETTRGEALLIRADDVVAIKQGIATGDHLDGCSTIYLAGGHAFEVKGAVEAVTAMVRGSE